MDKTELRKCTAALTGALDGQVLSVEDHLYAIRKVRELLDHEERKTVQRGRRAGMTWARLGDILGTTRQAAQQRFRQPTDHMF